MPDILNSYLKYARGNAGPLSPWSFLNVLSHLVRPFIKLRAARYDRGMSQSVDPPIPVISVGNLCHGGTNKTPMVEIISRGLADAGLSVGIVSRGYGGQKHGGPVVVGQDEASSDRGVTGDEPLLLARKLAEVKVVVSRDRYEGVKLLADLGVDVVVADDAFQHRKMGRDLDIVMIDATCPFGNRRLFPAGILREEPDALRRADMVVVTKVEQISEAVLAELMSELARIIEPERIFTARIAVDFWMTLSGGELVNHELEWGERAPSGPFMAFSAIAHPDSFYRTLELLGTDIAERCSFRDHHRYSWGDINELERRAAELEVGGFICTEKDIHNMPESPVMTKPLYVPCITVAIDENGRFWRKMAECLRPHFVVVSNGYGEDAIGALLAEMLQKRYRSASVNAFALVGRGEEYRSRGIEVVSPPSETPSGGVVKYSLRELWRDLRHGLRGHIRDQIKVWRQTGNRYRTPICIGDVYLLLHTLWGQGLAPLLVATAKSMQLSGHFWFEKRMLRRRARKVWTRDESTKDELVRAGVDAVFRGSPIMDLALEGDPADDVWSGLPRPHVMLLPGSRPRAYKDIVMLLDAVRLLNERVPASYVMVLAPTIDAEKLAGGVPYELDEEGRIHAGSAEIIVFDGPIASAAFEADILMGLGGTANQVSAGLGVPVISILERGKLVQKKMLKDAEVLVPATSEELAAKAEELLNDPLRRNEMARVGIAQLGGPGALESVVSFTSAELGWDKRVKLYEILNRSLGLTYDVYRPEEPKESERKCDRDWRITGKARGRLLRLARIIKGREVPSTWGGSG